MAKQTEHQALSATFAWRVMPIAALHINKSWSSRMSWTSPSKFVTRQITKEYKLSLCNISMLYYIVTSYIILQLSSYHLIFLEYATLVPRDLPNPKQLEAEVATGDSRKTVWKMTSVTSPLSSCAKSSNGRRWLKKNAAAKLSNVCLVLRIPVCHYSLIRRIRMKRTDALETSVVIILRSLLPEAWGKDRVTLALRRACQRLQMQGRAKTEKCVDFIWFHFDALIEKNQQAPVAFYDKMQQNVSRCN